MITEISNEALFYGGLTAAGIAAAALVIFLIAFLISGIRLRAKLDWKDKIQSVYKVGYRLC